jgi:hypothetical protein
LEILSKSVQSEKKIWLELACLGKLRHETRERRNCLLQRNYAYDIEYSQGQSRQQIGFDYLNLIR